MSAGAEAEISFERALELHTHGRDEEAKLAYLEVLKHDATHLGALENLGTLLFNSGYRRAARTAYRQAVAHHPESTMARVNFGNALYDNDELFQAREQYEAALRVDSDCAEAHQGLAYVLDKLGEEHTAHYHRDRAYTGRAAALVPYRGTEQPIAVLLVVSALGGNVNTYHFLDDRVYLTTKIYAEYYDRDAHVPFHSFVFNAIGDADLCLRGLEAASALIERTNAPVINSPTAVLATGRADNAERLGGIPGVVAPKTRVFARDVLVAPNAPGVLAERGFRFPLLLRTPGFHTGQHFLKVDVPETLPEAAARLPGQRLTAIEYLDARGPDARVRKYRTIVVDGKLYPLHLAISPQWKVHYFTADMKERPEHRAEEAAFLDDMQRAIGAKAIAALTRIAQALALDYAGIDFGLDAGGNVLLFEANATMLVPVPDPDPRFDYRRPATEGIFAAMRAMLADRHRASLGTR